MLSTTNINAPSLTNRLIAISRKQFTGSLNVVASSTDKWSLYFFRGRIVWGCSGQYSRRQLRQHIIRYQVKINPINLHPFQINNNHNYWIYQLLCSLLQEQQITREQFDQIIKSIVLEILFDILQQENQRKISYKIEPNTKKNILNWPIVLIDTKSILKKAVENWCNWSNSGLKHFSPNFGIVLSQPEQFQAQISPTLYNKLGKLINSQRSLRDIASKTKSDQFRLAKFLLPHIQKGLIKLKKIPDIPVMFPHLQQTNPQLSKQGECSQEKENQLLIACIDDSLIVCHQMKQIFTANSFDFVGINSSVKAIITLIERKPDLIFLDLIMPIANGYEICAQIRRISALKETPVIILTSSNRLIDRVRATMAGCTDYLIKPIKEKQVLEIVNKYVTSSSCLPQKPISETLALQFS
ncbi:MAG: response regulator [Okeania sp. SIO3B5]|uniref:response regulator n=1 Tax=Okeania sp. SIO3B5 TaxID=2607811 RepID=UPI001401843B|nr:response regulator [Okeania sp. SIO3B5]NEO56607.1 response regulator [Okeania sp. SIO3B5]